jgi:hypothetical protein
VAGRAGLLRAGAGVPARPGGPGPARPPGLARQLRTGVRPGGGGARHPRPTGARGCRLLSCPGQVLYCRRQKIINKCTFIAALQDIYDRADGY